MFVHMVGSKVALCSSSIVPTSKSICNAADIMHHTLTDTFYKCLQVIIMAGGFVLFGAKCDL